MYPALLPRVDASPGAAVLDGTVTALPRPHRDDVLIAAAGLLGGVAPWALGLHTQNGRPLPGAWVLFPLAVTAAMEIPRRTAPRTALTVGTLALVADQFTIGSLATVVMFTDLVYAAVLYGSPAAARRIPRVCALLTVVGTVVFLTWFRTADGLVAGVAVGIVGFAPAATGALVRNHRDAAEAARLRADQTALLAEMDRSQAVAAERARMARELHDMVANHLSAIAIHSTAALSLGDARTTRDALTVIRENSVQGLDEMRRLIGLLRDSGGGDGEEAGPAAAPTLRSLDALLGQARTNGASSGLVFTLTDRRPAGHALPTPVELAAYRIVQEALTNALKHAAPGEVTIELVLDSAALAVRVVSPFGTRPGPRAPGSGAGLVGMRERVALLKGAFEAGAVTTGGGDRIWRVRALLPVEEGHGGR